MATTEQLNTALAGRYAIDRRIGEGGMATVYLAKDLKHDRRVALKVLKPELGAVLGVERFLSEIKVTANLQHPNLLPLFDSGEANGLLFYVMPFVEGESLRTRLDREQQLSIDEAVRIASAVASALAYAHDHGVIHRDLKPENILLQAGQPVIADFGIALAVSNAGGARVTQTGLSLGTPQYMSPEQATGDRTIDARSDLYSLAAMTYEMIAGEPPHTGPNAQAIMAKLLTADPTPLSSLRSSAPVHVELAIAKALAKVPADRFASAAEFAAALSGEKALAMPTRATRGVAAVATHRRIGAREVLAWALAAAGIVAAFVLRPKPEAPRNMTRAVLADGDSIFPAISQGGLQFSSVAISPDGALVAYVADPVLRTLYVREMASGEDRRIVGVERVSSLSISPDGRSVAFTDPSARLFVAPIAGGPARQVGGVRGSTPSWGDDGALYFLDFGKPKMVPPGGTTALPIQPIQAPGDSLEFNNLSPLPGSTRALVSIRRSVDEGRRIAVVDFESGALADLDLPGDRPQYADDGFIVYLSAPGVVSAVKFDAATFRVTVPPVVLATDVAGWSFSVARRTGALVYRAQKAQSGVPTQLALVDRRGAGRVLIDDGRHLDQPRVSPDGRRIALRIGGADFNTGDLWIYELAGGALSRLTSDGNSYRATWARDGSQVFFMTGNANNPRLWARPWDGSTPASLQTEGVDIAEYDDGAKGALSMARTWRSRDLATVPRDSIGGGRKPALTRLTDSPANETQPALAPDATLVAYQSDETGQVETYVRSVSSGGKRLAVSVGGGRAPRWAPDGKSLYYVRDEILMAAQLSLQPELAVARRDSLFALGGALNSNDTSGERPFDVMPNGRELVIVRAKAAQKANPLRTVLLLDWQTLFATPARGKAP
jgi:serine/threonine-protein kinase